jgi:hypothetical protein
MAPTHSAPLPPAPVADPSARMMTKRHILQASAEFVR